MENIFDSSFQRNTKIFKHITYFHRQPVWKKKIDKCTNSSNPNFNYIFHKKKKTQ